ncbi:MAG TPA: MlaD family protein [Solirubrobacteraceae bacterium]|nr:MlaD family protein [Solirubrobacteraceae bacterium]
MRRRSKKRRPSRVTLFQAGLIGLVVIVLFSYAAYTKFANPFAGGYTLHATFSSANGLQPNSLVRIAGVNVGKVTGVSLAPGCSKSTESSCQAADVTMAIQSNGLPIHQNATFAIRPRIFLEGNFFVDLMPGTPGSPIAQSGHTFPIQQGTEPVQFDQVLGALPANTRTNLQTLLAQYGKAVDESGPSFNRSVPYWLPAYKYSAIVAHDALGILPHDLSNFVAEAGTTSGAFAAHPEDLENLITNIDTTAAAFARQNTALADAVGELPRTLAAATPALNALNAAFPPLNKLSTALLPGVRSTGPTVDVSLPFLKQLRFLVEPSELGGLTTDLSKTVPSLAKLTVGTIPLMENEVRPVASCVANVIYPWSQLTLNDGTLNAQGMPLRPVYVEAVDYLPGLAGESRDFDSNGPYIRTLLEGGSLTYSLQPGLFGQALEPIAGVQPVVPATGRPPLEPNVPCETQAPITSLSEAPGAPPVQIKSANLSAPGAKLRWLSAVQVAISTITHALGQQGLKVNVPSDVKALLKP